MPSRTKSSGDNLESGTSVQVDLENQSPLPHSQNPSRRDWLQKWCRKEGSHGGGYDGFRSFDLQDFPNGYPRFAALMNRDDNTRLYRRFGWARNRLLLCKQDRVAELHNELRSMDKVDEREHPEKLWSRRHGQDSKDDSPRSRVLDRLEVELEEYDALLLREHAIASISSPTKQNHRAIFDWVHNNKPVVPEEYQYLYEDGDFVLVGNQQDDWLHSIQERIWSLSQHGFFRSISSSKSCYSRILSNAAVKIFVSSVMTVLLMLPIILLYFLDISAGIRLVILGLFVLAFSTALSAMTKPKRHEAFAATAAYAAVLVMFLSNLPAQAV